MTQPTWFQQQYEWGLAPWKDTYGDGLSDDEALTKIATGVASGTLGDILPQVAAAKWVHGACRTLTTSGSYFAAMACTKLNADAADELRVPWPSFAVEIPAGILHAARGDYRYIHLTEFEDVTGGGASAPEPLSVSTIEGAPESGLPTIITPHRDSLADLLFKKTMSGKQWDAISDEYPELERWGNATHEMDIDEMSRLANLAHRAVVGLLVTVQHTNNWKASAFSPIASRKLREAPPPHRTIVVGRPLKTDFTPAIRAAIAGRGSSEPAVQTLVRGHLKRQVVGAGRSGRKIIWVQPYWRGPELAPIMVRPYKVGPGEPGNAE